jgi:hypothetical protein
MDLLMPTNGGLHIAAKIPKVVDECRYKGNLLSGVPMVTCLVSPKPTMLSVKPPKHKITVPSLGNCHIQMPLQCPTRGCAAEIALPLSPHCYEQGKCKLDILVNQTDYDNKDGTPELIEYIKVDGKEVKKDLKPGQNPCKSAFKGNLLQTSKLKYKALEAHDLKNIKNERILIEGKISRYVDECASNGYLFDAVAEVTCKSTAKPIKVK